MNLWPWVLVLALTGGCKKKEEATPAPAPAKAPSSLPAAPSDAGGSTAPVAALALDSEAADEQTTLGVAFDNKIPRLPALSADGHMIADYDFLGDGPMDPQPVSVVISKFPAGDSVETLPLLTVEEGTKAEGVGSNWTTPDVRKQLHERATAAVARLRGFRSLERVRLGMSSGGEPLSTKIGALTLVPQTTNKGRLVLELRGDKAAVLHREQVEPYTEAPCDYLPTLSNVYRDPAGSVIHLQIGFRFTAECDPGRTRWVSWSL